MNNSKLVDKIEQLPEVRKARDNYDEADLQAHLIMMKAECDLMETLSKHYLGAWWEFVGQYKESCGNRATVHITIRKMP